MASWVARVCSNVGHDTRGCQTERASTTRNASTLLRPEDVLATCPPTPAGTTYMEPCATMVSRVDTRSIGNGDALKARIMVQQTWGTLRGNHGAADLNQSFTTRRANFLRPTVTTGLDYKTPDKSAGDDSSIATEGNELQQSVLVSSTERNRHCTMSGASQLNSCWRQGARTTQISATGARPAPMHTRAHQATSQPSSDKRQLTMLSASENIQLGQQAITTAPWREALLSKPSRPAITPSFPQQHHQLQPTHAQVQLNRDPMETKQNAGRIHDVVRQSESMPAEKSTISSSWTGIRAREIMAHRNGPVQSSEAFTGTVVSAPAMISADETRGVPVHSRDSATPVCDEPVLSKGKSAQSASPWLRALLASQPPPPPTALRSLASPPTIPRASRQGSSKVANILWGSKMDPCHSRVALNRCASPHYVHDELIDKKRVQTKAVESASPELKNRKDAGGAKSLSSPERIEPRRMEQQCVDSILNAAMYSRVEDPTIITKANVNCMLDGELGEDEVRDEEAEDASPNRAGRRIYLGCEHGKVSFLFPNMSPRLRDRLQFDEESLWSVTDQNTADEISNVALMLPGVSAATLIVDGTACVGGNVLSFAASFDEVWAVEIDQDRFELLRSNVRNTSKSCPSIRRVRYFNDDILRVLEQEREIIEARRPVFFLDPPWGGVDYKKQGRVDLFLSDVPLAKVCARAAQAGARHILIKVPTNFDLRGFCSAVGKTGHVTVHERKMRKMLLVAVDFDRRSSPRISSSSNTISPSPMASALPVADGADHREACETRGGKDAREKGSDVRKGRWIRQNSLDPDEQSSLSSSQPKPKPQQRGRLHKDQLERLRRILTPQTSPTAKSQYLEGFPEPQRLGKADSQQATACKSGDESKNGNITMQEEENPADSRPWDSLEGKNLASGPPGKAVDSPRMNNHAGASEATLSNVHFRRGYRKEGGSEAVEGARRMLKELLGLDTGRGLEHGRACKLPPKDTEAGGVSIGEDANEGSSVYE